MSEGLALQTVTPLVERVSPALGCYANRPTRPTPSISTKPQFLTQGPRTPCAP